MMLCRNKILVAVACLLMGLPATAQPSDRSSDDRDQVVTRSELVVDLEEYLSTWESQTSNYVTKDELSELRALVLQLREEMDGLGVRGTNLEDQLDGLDQRSRNTRRPGF